MSWNQTITTLWDNSADDEMMSFSLILPRKKDLTFYANGYLLVGGLGGSVGCASY